MKTRLVIDGNAVYEIDEECMRRKKEREELEKKKQKQEEKTIRKNR